MRTCGHSAIAYVDVYMATLATRNILGALQSPAPTSIGGIKARLNLNFRFN